MSPSYLISLALIYLLYCIIPYQLILSYCIYEQLYFQYRARHLARPYFFPPLVGYLYESIYPQMRDYKDLWKQGELTATTVFGRFIVICNSYETSLTIFNDHSGKIEFFLVDSMKKIISPKNLVFSNGNIHKGQRAYFLKFLTDGHLINYAFLQHLTFSLGICNYDKYLNYANDFRHLNIKAFFIVFFGTHVIDKWYDQRVARDGYLDIDDYETVSDSLSTLTSALQLVNIPLNFPGTNVYNAIKARERTVAVFKKAITNAIQNRLNIKCLLTDILDENKDKQEFSDPDDLALAIFTFIFASQDALTSAVTWLVTIISQHPKLQEEYYQEFKKIHEDTDAKENTFVRVKSVSNSLVKEVLRLRPPVIMAPQLLLDNFTIKNVTLSKGTIIIPSIWASAHNSINFGIASEFYPDRFKNSTESFPKSHVFGSGSHACLGQNYTIQHLSIFLYSIILNFKISTQTSVDINNVKIFSTSYPAEHIKFKFEKRA